MAIMATPSTILPAGERQRKPTPVCHPAVGFSFQEREMDLTDEHLDLLNRIRGQRALPLADRRQDRIRQQCRKAGLIECVAGPRRWRLTQYGLSILNKVERPAA